MLATQISYWELVETKRHQQEVEKETAKHNRVTEQETALHNRTVEAETERHNRATENYNDRVLEYNYNVLEETTRHNKEVERLQHERNLNDYLYQRGQLQISREELEARQEQNRIALKQALTQQKKVENDYKIANREQDTKRLQVHYAYNLGIESNYIAKQNAETNALRARTEARESQARMNLNYAQAERLNQQSKIDWYSNSLENKRINLQRETATANIQQRQQEIQLGYDNLSYSYWRTDEEMWQRIFETTMHSIDNFVGVAGGMVGSQYRYNSAIDSAQINAASRIYSTLLSNAGGAK
jgi:hypothetical protein